MKKYEYLENDKELEKTLIKPLEVNTNIDKYFSFGDDIIDEVDDKIFRVATIQDGNSFLHCILKILNINYNKESLKERIKMSDDFRDELVDFATKKEGYFATILPLLDSTDELNERAYCFLCDLLNINITIYIYEKNKIEIYDEFFCNEGTTVHILKNKNNCFEPLGKMISGKLIFNF